MRKRLLSRRADQCVEIRSRFSIPSAPGAGGSYTAHLLPGQVEAIDVVDMQGPIVSAGREDRTVVRKCQAAEIGGAVLIEWCSARGPGARVPETDPIEAPAHEQASVRRERNAGEVPVDSGKMHTFGA